MSLSPSMTVAELLALPQSERQAMMRALQERVAELGDYRPPQPVTNTQQGDGSVGVMRMPAAFPGTVLSGEEPEDLRDV